MTTGLDRVRAVLDGRRPDGVPIVPILHTMAAHLAGVLIGEYAADPVIMADCVVRAYRRFGYDGVQLSLGVAAEAEALGAGTLQPEDGLPVVTRPLLQDTVDLSRLALPDVTRDGRLGLFAQATRRVVQAVGAEAWVIATIRGPLLMATQLRGVEQMLIDLIERPAWCADLLAFTTEVGIAYGRYLMQQGAHAIAIGEATCSPDFISPRMYRQHVLAYHSRLVGALHEAGEVTTIMHICGHALPLVSDVAGIGCDVMDIDSQVDPARALSAAGERMVLRGNIEPSDVLLYGDPNLVAQRVEAVMVAVAGRGRLILGSGCDVPPDTPAGNIEALVRTGRRY